MKSAPARIEGCYRLARTAPTCPEGGKKRDDRTFEGSAAGASPPIIGSQPQTPGAHAATPGTKEQAGVATHRKPWNTRDLEHFTRSIARDEDGQTMAEYAVILGVLVIACVAAFPALNAVINDLFGRVADAIKSA